MKIINLGSINIDHVYTLNHFVQPGETIPSNSCRVFPGGKGFNQSLALSRCGANVFHAGKIGADGQWLKHFLMENGVDTSLLKTSSQATGHAVIQVVPSGENAIIIYAGANSDLDDSYLDLVLSSLEPGDYLLLQNEISNVADAMQRCQDRDIRVFFNPAPMTAEVMNYPLYLVDTLLLNQVEALALSGEDQIDAALSGLKHRFPKAGLVITLGAEGVVYSRERETIRIPALNVSAVDTTAAGDTFIGFLLGEIMAGKDMPSALNRAVTAAAICVTRQGAAVSIPCYQEVMDYQP